MPSPASLPADLASASLPADLASSAPTAHAPTPAAPAHLAPAAADGTKPHANGATGGRFSRCFSIVGSPHYVAPEVLRATGHSTPVDWWALGVIAFELLTGRTPFGGDGDGIRDVQERVLAGEIEWPSGKEAQPVSSVARDLISRLLTLATIERCVP